MNTGKLKSKITVWLMACFMLVTNIDFTIFAKDTTQVLGDEKTGFIFNDKNHNGVKDKDELGIEGITLQLADANNKEILEETTTDQDGKYTFHVKEDGTYKISVYANSEQLAPFSIADTQKMSTRVLSLPSENDKWAFQYDSYKGKDDLPNLAMQEEDLESATKIIEKSVLAGNDLLLNAKATKDAQVRIKCEKILYKGTYVNNSYILNGQAGNNVEYVWRHVQGENTRLYCVQIGVGLNDNDMVNRKDTTNLANILPSNLSKTKVDRIKRLGYFGANYPGWNLKEGSDKKTRYHMATQKLIWEAIGATNVVWTYDTPTKKNKDKKTVLDLTAECNAINAKVNQYDKKASFEGQIVDVERSTDKNHVYTFDDKNNVLKDSVITSVGDGIKSATIENNKLKIVLKNNAAYDGKKQTITFKRNYPNYAKRSYFYANGKQSVFYFGTTADVNFNFSIMIKSFGNLEIQKVDDLGRPVAGVKFRYGPTRDTMTAISAPTDANGKIAFPHIAAGSKFSFQEYEVPSNIVKSSDIKDITIVALKTNKLHFVNQRVSYPLTIKKVSEKTGKPIKGATFTISGVTQPYVTDENGQFTTREKFYIGDSVTVTEVSPGPGFMVPSESLRSKTLTINADPSKNTLTFVNTPIPVKLKIYKIKGRDKEPIAGVSFKIGTNLDGPANQSNGYYIITTDKNGLAESPAFDARTKVSYQEVSAPKYIQLDPTIYNVPLEDADITITIENEEKPLSMRIHKTGVDAEPLKNAEFAIERYTRKNGRMIWFEEERVKTNGEGIADSKKTYDRKIIEAGNIRLRETQEPAGYEKLKEPIKLTKEQADVESNRIEIYVENDKIPTYFQLFKYDEDNPSEGLKGAIFEITDVHGNLVQKLETNSQGYAETRKLFKDKIYYIQEVKAPIGYKIINPNKERLEFTEKENNVYVNKKRVPNDPINGFIEVHKTDTNGKDLKGIEFTIYKNNEQVDKLITDVNGYAKSKELLADAPYTIVETYAPPQYYVPAIYPKVDFLHPQDRIGPNYRMTFNENTMTMSYDIENTEKLGTVTVKKVDAETDEIVVRNAEYHLFNYRNGKDFGTAKTNDEGIATFYNVPLVNPTVDPLQGYYCVREVGPGDNHTLPEDVTEKEKYFALTIDKMDLSFVFKNPPVKGNVEINKVDKDDPTQKLKDAKFSIYKADDLDGKPVASAKTNEEGKILFKDLRYGDYVIKEDEASPYHYIDEKNGGNDEYYDKTVKGYRVTISEDGKTIPITITNPKKRILVSVHKTDSIDRPLRGAKFHLCATNGTILETLITNGEGNAKSTSILAEKLGEHPYVIEAEKLPGYELDTNRHYFSCDSASTEAIKYVALNITNKPEIPEIKIRKIDEKGDPVEAKFDMQATSSKGTLSADLHSTKTDPIMDMTKFLEGLSMGYRENSWLISLSEKSTENGHIRFPTNCTINFQYYLDPTDNIWKINYLGATNDPYGQVSFDDETLTITVVNQNIPVNLQIDKTDESGTNYLNGAIFMVTPIKDNQKLSQIEIKGNSGKVSIPYADSYYIEETFAPDDYFKMSPKTLNISDFSTQTDGEQIIEYHLILKVKDIKQPNLKIIKIGSDGKPLDATFRMYTSGSDNEILYINTKKSENGSAKVNLQKFYDRYKNENATIDFRIQEDQVDGNYELFNGYIEGYLAMQNQHMNLALKSSNNSNIKIETGVDNSITITVTDKRKDFDYQIQKKGVGTNNVNANINIAAYKQGTNTLITSVNSLDISTNAQKSLKTFFDKLDTYEKVDVRIEENSTTEGYQKLSKFLAFAYYPDKVGKEKFQNLDSHVGVDFDSTKNLFTLTLTNELVYGFSLRKMDSDGHSANATFDIKATAGDLVYETSVKTDYGIANLSSVLQELSSKNHDATWTIVIKETKTDGGLQLIEGNVVEFRFYPNQLSNPDSFLIMTNKFGHDDKVSTLTYDRGHPYFKYFTVTNTVIPVKFRLIKTDKDSGKPLADAKFEIKSIDSDSVINITTTDDPNGVEVTLPYAQAYTVRETYAPEEYAIDDTVYTLPITDFTLDTDGTLTYRVTLTLPNEKITGQIEIEKYDKNDATVNKEKFKGTIFKVYAGEIPTGGTPEEIYNKVSESNKYELVDTLTIGADGTAITKELPYGSYILKEVASSGDYKLSKILISQRITKDKEIIKVYFPNELEDGELNIFKYFEEEQVKKPLANAEFTIHQQKDDKQIGDTYITNADGYVSSIILPYGDYYVKEINFPAGFAATKGTKHPFTINKDNQKVTIEVKNTKAEYALRLHKRDKDSDASLAYAVFGLYEKGKTPSVTLPNDIDKEAITVFKTNESGNATIMIEKPGDYDIYELSPPDSYKLVTEKYEIHVDDKTPTADITVYNKKKTVTITIQKDDEADGKKLSGAYFDIKNKLTDKVLVHVGPTDENGTITTELPAGKVDYVVVETTAPDGYQLDTTPHYVVINQETDTAGNVTYKADPIIVHDRKMNGNISVLKVDKDDHKIVLEGAEFEVYNAEGKLVQTITTNSKGVAMTKELPIGKYTLKETKAPDGYEEVLPNEYTAELSEKVKSVELTVENTRKMGSFTIKKVDALDQSKTISGVEFKAYATRDDAEKMQNELYTKISDAHGIATFKDVPYGTYYARETKLPDDTYALSDEIVEVKVNELSPNTQITYENYPNPTQATFKIIKRDIDTKEKLAGAIFRITNANGYEKEYETDASGTFITEELPFDTYTVEEIKAPGDYKLSNPIKQEVKLTLDAIDHPVTVTFEDKKIESSIRILKTDNSEEAKPLAGAIFDIYALNEEGQKIEPFADRLVTDQNGIAKSKALPMGQYVIEEVLTPHGYTFIKEADDKFHVTIDANSPEVIDKTYKNKPIVGNVEVYKMDSETKKALAGVEFTIFDADHNAYAKRITGEDGYARFNDIPYGTYYLRETDVPDDYELDDSLQKTFKIDENVTETIHFEIENHLAKGRFALTKVDTEDANLGVAGAVYGIYTKANMGEEGILDIDLNSYLGSEYNLITKPNLEEAITDEDTGEETIVSKPQPVFSKELPYGTYYVKEISSPDDYKLNKTVYTVNLSKEQDYVEVIAEDEKYSGSVEIHKVDKDSGKKLEGAVFMLFTKAQYDSYLANGDDENALYLKTDANGEAKVDNLKLNETYILIEDKAPDGYNKDLTIKEEFTIKKEQLAFSYTFKNQKYPSVLIKKVNEQGYPLEGVVFGVYSFGEDGVAQTADDQSFGEFATGYDGTGYARYDISNLPYGWYYVKETKEPDYGYEKSKEIKTFEVTADRKDYEFTFVNHRMKGNIEIWKTDEVGNPMTNAEFALYKAGDSWFTEETVENTDVFIQKFEMDENAHAIIENLPADCYVIKETKTPDGYETMEDVFFDLSNGEKKTEDDREYYYYGFHFANYPITGNIKIQKAIENTTGISVQGNLRGAMFEILNEKGTVVETLISNEAGEAISRELPKGIYTIKESKEPDGTILNKELGTVSIDGSQEDHVYTYTHTNPIVTGTIQIIKEDENKNRLKGAEFDVKVYGTDEIVDHLISDENGLAETKELPYGWYTIIETKAPDGGYDLDPNAVHNCFVGKDKQVKITIVNVKDHEDGNGVQVIKYDKDDASHYLKGAVFDLYAKDTPDKIIQTYITDENGYINIKDLPEGDYVLKEVQAPEGYTLSKDVEHPFTLGSDTHIVLRIANERLKGRMKFEKTGEMLAGIEEDPTYPGLKKLVYQQQELKGAAIGVYAKTDVFMQGQQYHPGDLILTLQSGETSDYLPIGAYTYKEIATPSAYIPDKLEHEILVEEETISEVKPAIAVLANQHAEMRVELYKAFSESVQAEAYDKVKFGVFTTNEMKNNEVTIPADTLVSVFGVDSDGKSQMTKQKLPAGSYYVKELETADDFIVDTKKHAFTLSYQNEEMVVTIATKEDPIVNEKVYGRIEIQKTGPMFTTVKKTVVNDREVITPVYRERALNGAKFEIRTKQEITINDKHYQPGEVMETLISGKNSQSAKLPLGTYEVAEVEAPDGYVKSDKVYTITLKQNENSHVPVLETCNFYNEKADVTIEVFKKFFNNKNTALYKNVLFGIYSAEDIHGNETSALLPKDALISLITFDEQGKGSVSTKLPTGKYYVKELETAKGYQVTDKIYNIEIQEKDAGIIPIEGIDKDHPVMNYPDGDITPFAFRKINKDGIPLAGAAFHLYQCDKEHTHADRVMDTIMDCWKEVDGLSPRTSDKDGIVNFNDLPDGDYQLKETKAPHGYALPEGEWFIHVDAKAEQPIMIIGKGEVLPPAFQKVDAEMYQYQLINNRETNLPVMGGTGMYLYIGGGSFLLMVAGMLSKKRKKEKK